MKIKIVPVGYLEENCYLLEQDGKILVVDPGDEAEKIITAIGEKKVEAILITHHHFDHVGALDKMKHHYQVPVYDFHVVEEKTYQVGPFEWTIIFTPGHSRDSITYYFKKDHTMMVGDFIFAGSIGRTDLESGNMLEMKQSIEKIKQYPDDTVLYPGHGPKTTLEVEKKYNPYF